MSKKGSDHGSQSWFQERDQARAAGGAAEEGMAPDLNPQEGSLGDAANPQEPGDQNTGNRGIGQYSGQGVPARIQK